MPACGGGIEIALPLIGTQVHLFPLSFKHGSVLNTLRQAVRSADAPVSLSAYEPRAVVESYLQVDPGRSLVRASAIYKMATSEEEEAS